MAGRGVPDGRCLRAVGGRRFGRRVGGRSRHEVQLELLHAGSVVRMPGAPFRQVFANPKQFTDVDLQSGLFAHLPVCRLGCGFAGLHTSAWQHVECPVGVAMSNEEYSTSLVQNYRASADPWFGGVSLQRNGGLRGRLIIHSDGLLGGSGLKCSRWGRRRWHRSGGAAVRQGRSRTEDCPPTQCSPRVGGNAQCGSSSSRRDSPEHPDPHKVRAKISASAVVVAAEGFVRRARLVPGSG